jgi:hypothetical protein
MSLASGYRAGKLVSVKEKRLKLTCSGSANLGIVLASTSGYGCAAWQRATVMAGFPGASVRTRRKQNNKNGRFATARDSPRQLIRVVVSIVCHVC